MNPIPVIDKALAKLDEAFGWYRNEEMKKASAQKTLELAVKWGATVPSGIVQVPVPGELTEEQKRDLAVAELLKHPLANHGISPEGFAAWVEELMREREAAQKTLEQVERWKMENKAIPSLSEPVHVHSPSPPAELRVIAVPKPPSAYPERTTAKIEGTCPNPRLLACRLEDGRKVSVWTKRGRKFRLGTVLTVVLDKVMGTDAVYNIAP